MINPFLANPKGPVIHNLCAAATMENRISFRKRLKLITDSTSLEASPASEKLITDSASSETSLASSEVIASNVDLLSEILLRLPPKSLLRFMSVSKNWLDLISDSQFGSKHARRNRNRSVSGLFFYNHYWSRNEQVKSVALLGQSSLPTPYFIECRRVRIVSSCNGLILCDIDCFINNRKTTCYVVCNLTTQEFTRLPEHGDSQPPAYLAFDPSQSPHYKVVLYNYSPPSYQFDIYSSESKYWRHITVDALPVKRLEGVFWNGAIHWLSNDHHIRFDVGSEELIQIPNPIAPKILSVDKARYFGECDDHLILIQMRLRSAMGFRILQMERDSFCWIVKCRVNLRPLISIFPEINNTSKDYKFHVLCVAKGVNKNELGLVLTTAGKVIYYNLQCKTLKVLRDDFPKGNFCGLYFNQYHYTRTYQFIESLFPV
ncbi:unnamed protein product [Camellia sinensis]